MGDIMTKGEARIKLDIDAETFKQVLKSCNYTEEKVFDCIKISVMKKYMKLASIKTLTEMGDNYEIAKTEVTKDNQIQSVEVVETSNSFYISRKELIEVIAAAYDRGFKDSKNVLPVLTKNIIDEMIDEVAVVRSEV